MQKEAPDNLYLLVEGEPFLSICRDWKRRHEEATEAAFAFAKRYGASGFFPGLNGEFAGLPVVDPIPVGWKIQRARRVSHQDRLVPAKGDAGDAIRQEIGDLPKQPSHHEIAEAIGHPEQVRWQSEGGCGFSVMGHALNPVRIGWAKDTFIIVAPNAEKYVAFTRTVHPGCAIIEGEWRVPDGLTVISEARMELIYAQSKVDSEQDDAA